MTVAALPFLWSAKNDEAAGSAGVLPTASATGGISVAVPPELISPELVEPAFLGGSVETVVHQEPVYDVAPTPTGQLLVGKAGYRRLAVEKSETRRSCQTPLAPYNARIVVTNTDNGFKIACFNILTKPIDPDLVIVLDTDAFIVLTDLAESPIPVELSW
jgi:hypothetical protein